MNCDFNPQYVEVKEIKRDKESLVFDESGEIIKELVYDRDMIEVMEYENNSNVIISNSSNIRYEYEYEIKYVRLNGEIIDKSTYDIEYSSNLEVYKMAFVGCTYHCG